jgi:hypothetical protein
MRADWEVLAEEPDDDTRGPPPWWRVHVPTFLGSLVMGLAAVTAVAGALLDGSLRSWLAALGLLTNALGLLGVARARHMMAAVEGETRKYARLSELGPWGRREWWFTIAAFAGFVVGMLALLMT